MSNIDKYIHPILLVGYTGKLLAMGASLPDALVLTVIAASYFLSNTQIQNKKVKELEEKVNENSNLVKALQAENESIKGSVANAVVGIKMNSGFKMK